jgi:hypothetical protein
MNDRHISRLENSLERLIEGAFARFFGRRIRAQDIALQLARAMENGLQSASNDDPRPVAPDLYQIEINQQTLEHILAHQPNLEAILGEHMLDLATQSGYSLDNDPVINLLATENTAADALKVTATHTKNDKLSTRSLRRVAVMQPVDAPINPNLVINQHVIPLTKPLVNLGRSLDSDIVLDDQYASRHHAQLRLRFGRYMLFDVQSRSGTFVNDVGVREHELNTGDVIRIGETRIIYMEDSNPHPLNPDTPTQSIDRVEGDQ